MKRLQTIAAYLAVLVLAGVSSINSAEPGKTPQHATVRTIHGTAKYSTPGGVTERLTVNKELLAGDKIITGADSFVYLSVNGISSAVRVSANTTLTLDKMDRTGAGRQGNTDTHLNLAIGSIVGQVKKVTGDSRYEITTPHGVAGIRGTDFAVDVVSDGNGQFTVTFTSITGTVVASAVVNGNIVTVTLNSGEFWTVGGNVSPVDPALLQQLINEIEDLISINIYVPPPVGPVAPLNPAPSG